MKTHSMLFINLIGLETFVNLDTFDFKITLLLESLYLTSSLPSSLDRTYTDLHS